MKVSWGKHAGMDIDKFIREHPAYAVWYANQCRYGQYHDDYMVISGYLDCDAVWLDFGKYKNSKLEDIVQRDKYYANWMLHDEWLQKNRPLIAREVKRLMS